MIIPDEVSVKRLDGGGGDLVGGEKSIKKLNLHYFVCSVQLVVY